MTIDKVLEILCGGRDEKKVEGFLKFFADKLWNQYNECLMDKVLVVENKVKELSFCIPNAKESMSYEAVVTIDNQDIRDHIVIQEVAGLTAEQHGLTVTVADDKKSFTISGTPSLVSFRKDGADVQTSDFPLTLKYQWEGLELPDSKPALERTIPFIINQDPRYLWKDRPVDWDGMPEPKYVKEDVQKEYVKVSALADGTPQKDMVAASKRGRSHAQEAKPRDDHFKLYHDDATNWYVMAVADGAGSAKYSREGSRIACETAVAHCKEQLANCKEFEESIELYNMYKDKKSSVAIDPAKEGQSSCAIDLAKEGDAEKAAEPSDERKKDDESDGRKMVGDYIYNIVGTAAFKAQKAISEEAKKQNFAPKLYATTLLLTISKKFSFGWFVASFWVGDGAICLYNREAHTANILGVPDEGEFGGQTRFLTMPDIFSDTTSLYKRLRFYVVPDFTALLLMTDGVSDAKFETDANLANPDKWDALWDDFKENGVELTDDNEASQDQLLKWLDFWVASNHDDRTIAMLY